MLTQHLRCQHSHDQRCRKCLRVLTRVYSVVPSFACLRPLPLPENPELALLGTIYLVDGSYFPTLHHVIWNKSKDIARNVKLHFIFDATRMVPAAFIVDAATSNERVALLAQLQARVTYVLDRGYMEFTLFLDIVKAQSSVVLRVYRTMIVETVEELPVILPHEVTAYWASVRDRLVASPILMAFQRRLRSQPNSCWLRNSLSACTVMHTNRQQFGRLAQQLLLRAQIARALMRQDLPHQRKRAAAKADTGKPEERLLQPH